MFQRTPDGVYISSLLASLPWVEHGFGTRHTNGWPSEYSQVKQIHSDVIWRADEQEGCLGRGDAIMTQVPERWVGIRTADCVPLLMADPHRNVVAAVHAGWRGSVARIAQKTVLQMAADYGSDPAGILVAIGPCIGECCYEVGPEVAAQFRDLLPEMVQPQHLDLIQANRNQLLQAGVRETNIDSSGLCTFCTPAEFHSYRRDGEVAGRLVAAIRIV